MNKKVLFLSIILTTILLGGCILNLPVLILAVVSVICFSLLALKQSDATNLLFYFSPLSYLLVYKQYSIYILIVVSYILIVLLKNQNRNPIGILAVFFLMAYCLIFSNMDVSIKIGQLIYPILLFTLIFVCQFTERENYKNCITFFLIGFIISVVIGFFKEQIPFIQSIFTSDSLYIDGVETSMNIQRYSGLSYDPNFFALIDCTLISLLLFNKTKMGLLKGVSILFLMVVGFFTFSKSYVILLAIILLAYVFINSKNPFKNIGIIVGALICLMLIERFSDIKVISLIEARFSSAENANDLTTGRVDLWINYLDYIFNNFKCFVFGEGFNALSLGKAVHNTYIDFIYRFGFVGTCLWLAYFNWSKKFVKRNGGIKTSPNITALVFFIGIFFLSAFHFQQLWCCIFFAMISPYSDGGKLDEVKRDCSNIQCGENTQKVC